MSVHDWVSLDRTALGGLLPSALVVLTAGAVEQHGPHLPTGTDSFIASRLARLAADRVAADMEIVLAPPLWVGASEHHVPFGGTLTLRSETMLAVLGDLLAAIAAAGARRALIVNGHGGNSGLVHAAAAAASARSPLQVAHLDYWRLVDHEEGIPGHAGWFETSMMLAAGFEFDLPDPRDPTPEMPRSGNAELHAAELWRGIDGYTDHPARASIGHGNELTEELVANLAETMLALGER